MGFYKNCEGLSFFLSVHLIFFLQIILIYYVEDKESEEGNIILIIHKIAFYIILLLTFYSHLQIAITDPGSIDYYNNIDILEFYYFIYRDINQYINSKHKHRQEYDEKYNRYSDKDDKKFEEKTSISDKLKREISYQFQMRTSRCYNCYVVRPMDAHHCAECHCCILERDHHCPWINNCVGLFNKKYFILFNMYAFISVIYSCFLYYYYISYKNFKTFRNDITKTIVAIFWGLFAFIYGLFVSIMIIEQRDNVLKEFKRFNKDKEIKKKMMGIKMRIIFGGEFSYKWFLPFFEGGKRQLLFFIRKKKYEMYQRKKNGKNKEIKNIEKVKNKEKNENNEEKNKKE